MARIIYVLNCPPVMSADISCVLAWCYRFLVEFECDAVIIDTSVVAHIGNKMIEKEI